MQGIIPKRRYRQRRIVEPTLRSIARALQEAVFTEGLTRRVGLFQSLEPRVKVLGVLELLISASLSRTPWVIAAIYLLALGLAWRSAVSPALLIRRVWLVMPLFTIPIALPALFLTPGPALAELPLGLTITSTGATSVLFLLLRISASLTLTLLLIYTTSWNTLLGALTGLRVPPVLILTLGMTYRYIHLLLRITNDMFMSRQSRIIGRVSAKDGQHIFAATAATLLGRSLKLSEDIYLAMLSRGFRGSIVNLRRPGMELRDWTLLLALTVFAAAGIWAGR